MRSRTDRGALTPPDRLAVSVIVPIYNAGGTEARCIESLAEQSLERRHIEVILVDDGSTDATAERLDRIAATCANVHVIHEAHSGWAGRPRNVGLDHATGDFVFFLDHDDWLAPEALERLVHFADDAGADIVIGKMLGHNRGVPVTLFRQSEAAATPWTAPLMTSLSSHKLFRRSLLVEHGIRFPDDPRRLEDHLVVVPAYLAAARIGVLSDYVCYHHTRLDGANHLSATPVAPADYFRSVREVVDVIEAHTEPGEQRNRLLSRPFTQEMLGRLSTPSLFDDQPEDQRRAWFDTVRDVMLERFPADFAATVPVSSRLRAAAVRDNDPDRLIELNAGLRRLAVHASLSSLRWTPSGWVADIDVAAVLSDGSPLRLTPLGDGRFSLDTRVLPAGWPEPVVVTSAELIDRDYPPSIVAVNRTSDELWFAAADLMPQLRELPSDTGAAHQVIYTGTARLDPTSMRGGYALGVGVWDVSFRAVFLGIELRSRVGIEPGLTLPNPLLMGARPHVAIPFATDPQHNLSIDVGQRRRTLLSGILDRPRGPVVVTGSGAEVAVAVDVAPGAAPRTVSLVLTTGSTNTTGASATIVPTTDGASLRITAKPRVTKPGTYSVWSEPLAGQQLLRLGNLDIDAEGRITGGDFS